MSRWSILKLAAAAAVLLLGGCATTYYPTYSDGSYPAARSSVHVGGSSYYAPSYSGYGDYYHGRSSVGVSVGLGVDFYAYPAYFSLFWPVNRWFYDPYWHPGYYYGVTYYPRNYFSYSYFGYGGYGPYAHWYSPYRYSWVDSYYAWDRWPRHHSYYNNPRFRARHGYSHGTPRFGHARNLAEREARARGIGNQQSRGRGLAGGVERDGRVSARAADYGSRATSRAGSVTRDAGVGRSVAPTRATGIDRGAPARRAASVRREASLRGAGVRAMDNKRDAALSRSSYRNARDMRGDAALSRSDGSRGPRNYAAGSPRSTVGSRAAVPNVRSAGERGFGPARGSAGAGDHSLRRPNPALDRQPTRAGRAPVLDGGARQGWSTGDRAPSRGAAIQSQRSYQRGGAPLIGGPRSRSYEPAGGQVARAASRAFSPAPTAVQPTARPSAAPGFSAPARSSGSSAAPARTAPAERSRGGSRSGRER